jgi:hypothetical protein
MLYGVFRANIPSQKCDETVDCDRLNPLSGRASGQNLPPAKGNVFIYCIQQWIEVRYQRYLGWNFLCSPES